MNDSCGGCSVLYLDAKGSQICKTPQVADSSIPVDRPGEPEEEDEAPEESTPETGGTMPLFCSSNEDCYDSMPQDASEGGLPFCAAGRCASPGTCTTDSDCRNPFNMFTRTDDCAGPDVCESGQCIRKCDEPYCENGNDPSICEGSNVCATSSCPESAVCVMDPCGGDSGTCMAMHFDAAGNVLELCDGSSFPRLFAGDDSNGNAFPWGLVAMGAVAASAATGYAIMIC